MKASLALAIAVAFAATQARAADYFEPASTAPASPLYPTYGPTGTASMWAINDGEVAPMSGSCADGSCTALGCTDPGCTSSCEQDCCGCCCCGPRFYAQAEALFFTRDSRLNDVPVVIQVTDEANAFPGATLLTLGAVGGNNSDPGLRLTFGWFVDDCRAWEVTYFGLWDLGGAATVNGPNNLAIPGDLGLASLDFFAADTITLTYNSRLNNAELNHVWLRGNNLSLLAGFRYVSLEDALNLQATDADTGTSNYNVTSRNNLYGGQVGARWARAQAWRRFGFDTTAKAGLFYNDASQTQFVEDFPGGGFFLRPAVSSSGDALAFVGDINLSATYQLTNSWFVRLGYNFLWIEGVAVAPGQFDFTDTPASGTATNFDGLFLHGVNVGFEGRW